MTRAAAILAALLAVPIGLAIGAGAVAVIHAVAGAQLDLEEKFLQLFQKTC